MKRVSVSLKLQGDFVKQYDSTASRSLECVVLMCTMQICKFKISPCKQWSVIVHSHLCMSWMFTQVHHRHTSQQLTLRLCWSWIRWQLLKYENLWMCCDKATIRLGRRWSRYLTYIQDYGLRYMILWVWFVELTIIALQKKNKLFTKRAVIIEAELLPFTTVCQKQLYRIEFWLLHDAEGLKLKFIPAIVEPFRTSVVDLYG